MTFTYLFSQVKYFITWYRKFTLCKASKNATNCVETEAPCEHGTCDKKILTPPSLRICPLFGELKKGDFFYPPSPLYGPMSPSQQFLFLLASLRRNTSCKDCTMLIVQFNWKIWKSFETRNMNKLFYW